MWVYINAKTRTHMSTHARTHARMHARTHGHVHQYMFSYARRRINAAAATTIIYNNVNTSIALTIQAQTRNKQITWRNNLRWFRYS